MCSGIDYYNGDCAYIKKMIREKKINRIPLSELPREKLKKSGISSLSDRDIIALLLRAGVKGKNVIELAEGILKEFTLSRLSETELEDLLQITVYISPLQKGEVVRLLSAFLTVIS